MGLFGALTHFESFQMRKVCNSFLQFFVSVIPIKGCENHHYCIIVRFSDLPFSDGNVWMHWICGRVRDSVLNSGLDHMPNVNNYVFLGRWRVWFEIEKDILQIS